MNYRQRREKECLELFSDFRPDLSSCRDKEFVLKVFELARHGFFSHEIAGKIGKTPKAIQKIFRRYNFPSLHNFSQPKEEERPGWKGGVKIVGGHAYKRSPGHPQASKHGKYVPLHRLIVEQHLGRFLSSKEVVHHKDGDGLNNDIDNLEVFSSNAEHLRKTLTGKKHNVSENGRKVLREQAIRRNKLRAKKVSPNQ